MVIPAANQRALVQNGVMLSAIPFAIMIQNSVSTTPAERLGEAWWRQRHEACVELTKRGDIDVVFLGDSITQGWEGAGKAEWQKHFAPLKAANFGFSGDRTEHVLWRLNNGEMTGLNAKAVVMMIGTNNIGHGSSNSAQTAEGIRAIISKLKSGLPKAKILLLAVFPRAEKPTDGPRVAVQQINDIISKMDDGHRVHYLDIGPHFVRQDGTLRTMLMPDLLHLNEGGYEIWAKAILPSLHKLLH